MYPITWTLYCYDNGQFENFSSGTYISKELAFCHIIRKKGDGRKYRVEPKESLEHDMCDLIF
jgi:hypothetical protein